MKKLLTKAIAVCFVFLAVAPSFAGAKADKYLSDLSELESAQSKNPKQIIAFSDTEGDLAKKVVDPVRVNEVLDEFSLEIDQAESFKVFTSKITPVMKNYITAFEQIPGKYDQEFLRSFEIMFTLLEVSAEKAHTAVALANQQGTMKDENMQKMMDAAIKMLDSIPPLLLKQLDGYIAKGKFSESNVEAAKALYSRLAPRVEVKNVSDKKPI